MLREISFPGATTKNLWCDQAGQEVAIQKFQARQTQNLSSILLPETASMFGHVTSHEQGMYRNLKHEPMNISGRCWYPTL